MNSSLADGTI